MNSGANIPNVVASIKWKLADVMSEKDITAYALGMELGGHTRISTVYRLANKDNPPTRVDFQTLADIVEGFRKLGHRVNLQDLIEYQDN